MISLQEKKTTVSNVDDAEVSDPTGKYVGRLEILSQLRSWRTAFPDAKTTGSAVAKSTYPAPREPKADRGVQSA